MPILSIIRHFLNWKGFLENSRSNSAAFFLLGLIESTTEIGAPFFTEAIWTEALQDIAPVLGRKGLTSDGRKIWNDEDSPGDKMSKALAHLVEAQAPFNWKQLGRLGLAMYPVDAEGKFDERGNEYELGNELAEITMPGGGSPCLH